MTVAIVAAPYVRKEQDIGLLLQRKEKIYTYCVSMANSGEYGMWLGAGA
jgi:hypothetical protein